MATTTQIQTETEAETERREQTEEDTKTMLRGKFQILSTHFFLP